MTEDPRCCGSGMCIIDPEGRCWCGQQWDGQKMCRPPLEPQPQAPAEHAEPGAKATGPGPSASDGSRLLLWAALCWPLALWSPQAAQAQAVSRVPDPQVRSPAFTAAEVKALQTTVQGQLAALAAGDATRAYAYASPAIQQQFGDAVQFMAMVQAAYPMIIRPSGLSFRLPERAAGAVVQPVQLRDAAGRAWLASYQLERQPAGGWRISGCIVTADDARLRT